MNKVLLAFLLLPFTLNAQDTVTVHTATELLAAIQSNRMILIAPGTYQLRDAEQMKVLQAGEEVHDVKLTESLEYTSGWGITLKNVHNISLVGLGKTPSQNRLVTSNVSDWIFTFKDCKDVVLKNLEAEHDPAAEGGCTGGVWFFYTCENVLVDNNRLLGSGRIGMEALEVNNLVVTQTDITECSEGILSFRSSKNAVFKDCRFFNNVSEYAFIDLDASENIVFQNCRMEHNVSTTVNDRYSQYNMFFRIYGVKSLVFADCSIKENQARYLTSNAEALEMLDGLKLKKNDFEEKFRVKKK